jgi:DNA mismatch repair protein MSH6
MLYSLDAVQDIIDHPTFESEFTEVAKGLPDLERIVSRIHAKNCKVRDFLRVLAVRPFIAEPGVQPVS